MGAKDYQEFLPLFGPGFYPLTVEELSALCVSAFPQSQTRQRIFQGLERIVSRLQNAGIEGQLWIDGSYLTEKIDPEDADLLLVLQNQVLSNPSQVLTDTLDWYNDGERHRTHFCDTYTHFEYEASHPQYWFGVWMHGYWLKQYGWSRGEEMKGIAVLTIGRAS